MFNDVQKFCPACEVNKEILFLVKEGLIEIFFDRECFETFAMPTKKCFEFFSAERSWSDTGEATTKEDLANIEIFSRKAEKDLTEVVLNSTLEE